MTIKEDSEKLLLKLYKCKRDGGEMLSSAILLEETGWDKNRFYSAMQYLIDSGFVDGQVLKGLGSTRVQNIVINDITPSGIDKVEHQLNHNYLEKSNNLEQVKQMRNEPVEESINPSSVNDQATKVDILGFEPYVRTIADFLTNKDTEPPLTLSIEGQWGTGKSSFMLQLKEIIESRNQKTVSFDAWRHDKEDAFWAAFALDFLHQVSHKLPWRSRIVPYFKLLYYRLLWKNRWLDLILDLAILILIGYAALKVLQLQNIITNYGYIIAIGVLLLSIKKFKDTVGNTIDIDFAKYVHSPDYENRLAFFDNFHKDFKKIVDAYIGENKVYVFIDDLDRCEVPKAADLMQALNLMITDDPSLIFIIGMDREKIAASFAVKHEKLTQYLSSTKYPSEASLKVGDQIKGLEYGYAFIEKFIQLPFLVPEPTKADLQRLLDKISKSNNHNTHSNKSAGKFSQLKNFIIHNILKSTKPISSETILEQIPSKLTEQQKSRRERIRIAVTAGDSQTIRDIALMVAPALDNNPRRLKQFINLFRLRALIADETGIFDALGDSSVEEGLALQQLGKFVVISLKWPLLLVELEANPTLLNELQQIAFGRNIDKQNFLYWTNQEKLMDLLRSGCLNDDGTPNSEKELYCSLSNLNINKLLQVSPRLVRPSPMSKPEVITKSINKEQNTNVSNNTDIKSPSNDPEQSEELITDGTERIESYNIRKHTSDLKVMLRLWQQNLSSNKVAPAEETFTFGRLLEYAPSTLRDIEKHALFEDIFHHFPNLRNYWNEIKTLSINYSSERRGLFDKIQEHINQKIKEYNFYFESENGTGFPISVYSEIVRVTKGKNNLNDYSTERVSIKGIEKTRLIYGIIGTGNGYILAEIEPERIEEVKKIHKKMINECEEIYLNNIKKIIELENKTRDSWIKLESMLDEKKYLMKFPHMDCKFVK